MKYTKKLFALTVALILALALAMPAMAAKITITNSVENETYKVYKIFDVTKAENATDESGYAYTISSTSEWYNTVNTYAADEDNGLTLTASTTSGVYNVTVDKLKFDAADFATTLSGAMNGKTVTAEGVGTGAALDITVNDAGYYFVDTSLGSLCSLLTSDQSVTLVEKNSIPSLEKYVQEDSAVGNDAEGWQKAATAEYGQSVEFWLSVNTGTNEALAADNKTGVDADYVITDEIPANMTLDVDNGNYVTISGWNKGTDFTETYDEGILTITLKQTKLATLGEDADIEIYYSATLTNTAVAGTVETNTATLSYKEQTDEDSATVVTYNLGGDANGYTITKVDGKDDTTPLAGVKFILKNETTGKYATFNTDTWKLTGWVTEEDDATELVTNDQGHIVAYGLDADTYILKETETLQGYNLLDDTITAVIKENGEVEYKYSSSETPADNSITIVNESGGLLPSTGGIGTTIFYTLGGLLVVGAAVLLVTKKRVHDMEA